MGDSTKKRIGPLSLVDKLYEGTLGVTWAGLAESSEGPDHVVAIRWIPQDEQVTTQVAQGMAAAAHGASWPDDALVVPVEDILVTDDGLAIVSEHIEGVLLKALLWRAVTKRRAIPAPMALRIALDLLSTIELAGEAPETRKPGSLGLHADNVLVGTTGRTYLLEPDACRFALRTEPWSRDPKWACYRAPESLSVPPGQDVRSDLFSVGVLLWEMLKNRPLFKGATYESVVRNVHGARVARLDVGKPTGGEAIHADLADVVAQALQRTPESRFETPQAMVEAIENAEQTIATADELGEFLQDFADETLQKMSRAIDRASRKAAADETARRKAADKRAARKEVADAPILDLDTGDFLDVGADKSIPPTPPPKRKPVTTDDQAVSVSRVVDVGSTTTGPPPPPRHRRPADEAEPATEVAPPDDEAAAPADSEPTGDEAEPSADSKPPDDEAKPLADDESPSDAELPPPAIDAPPVFDDAPLFGGASGDADELAADPVEADEAGADPVELPVTQSPIRLYAIVAAGVLLVGLIAYFALRGSDAPTSPAEPTSVATAPAAPTTTTVDTTTADASAEETDELDAGQDAAEDAAVDAAPTAKPYVPPRRWRPPRPPDIYE